MAKYTDPNTGVKYSTHTGLKVFTVIVVILLVISVVLNAVLFMQSSDDSVVDSSEGGELDGGYGDGENGDGHKDDDGSSVEGGVPSEETDGDSFVGGEDEDSSDGDGTPEPGEGIVDTETVIEKELGNGYYGVELSNGYAVRTSEFDEYGAATCLYYYYYENIMGEKGTYNGCEYCQGPCEGHKRWITKGGAVYGEAEYDYDPRPDVRTQVLYAEDDSTDINSKVRVSLVFDRFFYTDVLIDDSGERVEFPVDDHAEYVDYYYTGGPRYIEISSLTGEPLEIESIEMKQYVYYEMTGSLYSPKYTEYRSKSGVDGNPRVNIGVFCPDETIVYFTGGVNSYGGECLYTLTLSDGGSYSFEYWCLPYPDLQIGAEVVDVD